MGAFWKIIFEFGPVVQEEIKFINISYLELWWPFCSSERTHLCNFGRGHHEEQFCELHVYMYVANSLRLGEGDVAIYFHTNREMCTPIGGRRAILGYVCKNGPVHKIFIQA